MIMEDPWNVFELETEVEKIETDDGTLIKFSAYGITGIGDELKAYEWENILRSLIDALPLDVTASGYIEREGEGRGEGPDLERLYVKGRTVRAVKPIIVWPEVP